MSLSREFEFIPWVSRGPAPRSRGPARAPTRTRASRREVYSPRGFDTLQTSRTSLDLTPHLDLDLPIRTRSPRSRSPDLIPRLDPGIPPGIPHGSRPAGLLPHRRPGLRAPADRPARRRPRALQPRPQRAAGAGPAGDPPRCRRSARLASGATSRPPPSRAPPSQQRPATDSEETEAMIDAFTENRFH